MEDGTAASPGGNDDRHDEHSSTEDVTTNTKNGHVSPVETMRFPWSSPTAPTSSTAPSSPASSKGVGHRRSISGSILAKLNLLRTGDDGERPKSRDRPPSAGKDKEPTSPRSIKPGRISTDDDATPTSPVSPPRNESAMAAALKQQQQKTRKRKGSLRKTALLGTKRFASEGRERRNSLLQRSPSSKKDTNQVTFPPVAAPVAPEEAFDSDFTSTSAMPDFDVAGGFPPQSLRRQFSYESPVAASSSDSGWSEPAAVTAARLSLVTDAKPLPAAAGEAKLSSPLDLKSPTSVSQTSQTSYASTTDDDDVLTFDRPANSFPAQNTAFQKPIGSTATSYFPSEASLTVPRRRSTKSRSSPLSHASYPDPEPHDYTETEYWGWVILFVTWLVFSVGMGSCLEVWSWAWDVGETPYAPPELEDDPTLPIVGYYPALMVLTGVVAWVWITVAWVGMKYFRHAKIEL